MACATDARAQVTPGPPVTIDGPSNSVVSLGGLAVGRDGTGGLVYVKQVAGVPHVFLSALVGGRFGGPVELDSGLPDGSSQPVIAASGGGLLAVAFVNGGNLYTVTRSSSAVGLDAPRLLAAGASSPSISATQLGKVYLAFTAVGSGGHDVRAAYYYLGAWSLEPTPLDAVPTDDAGVGSGRPSVVAAGDGLGVVAWGEGGHIYVRRVRAASPSVVYAQLDLPTFGHQREVSADEPAISGGGDSSYVDVAYHETLTDSTGVQQSRVLTTRLVASQAQQAVGVDGVSAGSGAGADDPQVALTESGRGFITAGRTDTHAVMAAYAYKLGALDPPMGPINALQGFSAPFAVPGIAGLRSTLIAYQYDPGPPGVPDIRVRYADDGVTLGGEQVISAPALGPTDAADGLAATGDVFGDAAVAFIQGSASQRSVVVDQFYRTPGGISAVGPSGYLRTAQPTLTWSPARSAWGAIRYTVTLDGRPVGTTAATSFVVRPPLLDGPHRWQVVGTDQVGQSSAMAPASFFVDRLAPVVTMRVSGRLVVGAYLHAVSSASDSAPPEVPGGSSGIAAVAVSFGDGFVYRGVAGKYHAYRRPGRYRITFVVSDRAGNLGTVSQVVRIKPKPKPKPKPKRKGKGKARARPKSHP